MTIDADVHTEVPGRDRTVPYLADAWIEHITKTCVQGPHPHVQPARVARRGSTRGQA
jgi:hypothetical protein